MTWVKIDDAIVDNPKIAAVGGLGLAVQVAGLAYCNRNLTDGFIPRNVVVSLLGWEIIDDDSKVWETARTCGMAGDDLSTRWVVEQVVRVGLWHDQVTVGECERCLAAWPEKQSHGYLIHDYPIYQPSAEDVLRERERTRIRVAKHRSKATNTDRNTVTNSVTTPISNGRVTGAPVPVPVPLNQVQLHARNEFERFWDSFPRKVGKRAARAAFERALKRAPADYIVAGTQRYRDDPNRTEQYTAHPTTWLNRDGWDDASLPSVAGKRSEIDALITDLEVRGL